MPTQCNQISSSNTLSGKSSRPNSGESDGAWFPKVSNCCLANSALAFLISRAANAADPEI